MESAGNCVMMRRGGWRWLERGRDGDWSVGLEEKGREEVFLSGTARERLQVSCVAFVRKRQCENRVFLRSLANSQVQPTQLMD